MAYTLLLQWAGGVFVSRCCLGLGPWRHPYGWETAALCVSLPPFPDHVHEADGLLRGTIKRHALACGSDDSRASRAKSHRHGGMGLHWPGDWDPVALQAMQCKLDKGPGARRFARRGRLSWPRQPGNAGCRRWRSSFEAHKRARRNCQHDRLPCIARFITSLVARP